MNCFSYGQEQEVGTISGQMPHVLKDVTLDFQEEQNIAQGCPYKLLRKIAQRYLPFKLQR